MNATTGHQTQAERTGLLDGETKVGDGGSGGWFAPRIASSARESCALLLQAGILLREMEHLAVGVLPPNLKVELDLPDGLWPIRANPHEVHQALVYLFQNARTAMQEGGRMVLSSCNVSVREVPSSPMFDAQPGDFVQITVSDTRSGRDRYQSDADADLRLARVAHVLRTHGGFGRLAWKDGCGATVSLFFPRAGVERISDGPLAESANRPGRSILIVDDEEAFRTSAGRVLASAGYQVLHARVGREALALFVRRRCDIAMVLVDLALTDLNAFTLVWALRRSRPELRIIGVIGQDLAETAGELKRVGVRRILRKPLRAAELHEAVTQTMAEPAECEPGLFLHEPLGRAAKLALVSSGHEGDAKVD